MHEKSSFWRISTARTLPGRRKSKVLGTLTVYTVRSIWIGVDGKRQSFSTKELAASLDTSNLPMLLIHSLKLLTLIQRKKLSRSSRNTKKNQSLKSLGTDTTHLITGS